MIHFQAALEGAGCVHLSIVNLQGFFPKQSHELHRNLIQKGRAKARYEKRNTS